MKRILGATGPRWGLLSLLAAVSLATSAEAQVERISVSAAGEQADQDSYAAVLSDDGSIIAFHSNATNLVGDDNNASGDIFLHDLNLNSVERVSLDEANGELGNGNFNNNLNPSISDDGNRIAFQNYSLRGFANVLVRDRITNQTTVVMPIAFTTDNPDREGRQEPALSGNGQYVAFHFLPAFQASLPTSARPPDDDLNRVADVFVYDLDTQPVPPIERVSRDAAGIEGRAGSLSASLSDDGRFVAFYSFADDLVAGDENLSRDVFVKDRVGDGIERVSVSSTGEEGNDDSQQAMISGNGQFVVYRSRAANLVSGDTNGHWDIFVHDRSSNITERVSVSSSGEQANHGSFSPSISDDGRYVVFRSNASNLVSDDTNQRWDIFVHDRDTGQTLRVSTTADGSEANGHSYQPDVSGDGNWISFESDATNLVVSDSNEARDIFRVPNPL